MFEHLVLDNKHPFVAVFDCDGTMWSGDSGYGFMDWSLEQGLGFALDHRLDRHPLPRLSSRHCERSADVRRDGADYAGLREQELRAAAAGYVEEFVRARVLPEIAVAHSRVCARPASSCGQ